jgi:electron transfer flavoprotein alpha subunit
MRVLLLAEHDNKRLGAETRNAAAAARLIGGPVHLLVAGLGCAAVAAEAAGVAGIDRVLLADDANYAHQLAEPLAKLIVAQSGGYDVFLAPATACGKSVMPRVAAALDIPQISEAVGVLAPDRFERPIYAGSIMQTVRVSTPRFAATMRPAAFAPAGAQPAAPVQNLLPLECPPSACFIDEHIPRAAGAQELTRAKIVVAGGRGAGAGGGFDAIRRFAFSIGAAIGASRAAVDAGLAGNDCQVGQSGKTIAPELYIACGISGAIQHISGIQQAKIIAAINKDPEAPIFRYADIGLVADIAEALPRLERLLAGKKPRA